jgi:hypothetical protein
MLFGDTRCVVTRALCLISWALGLAVSGCALAHERSLDAGPLPDGGCDPIGRPPCVQRASPCEPLTLVDAICPAGLWECPEGASLYVRPWDGGDLCLPLRGRPLLADGVHEAPVPVPIDGVCEWVFPVESASGTPSLAAVPSASSCEAIAAAPMLTGLADPPAGEGSWLALGNTLIAAEHPRVLARGWRFDPSAAFGVRSLGVGLASVRDHRIVLDAEWLFGDPPDLGDAAIAEGGYVYAYGCPGTPHDLLEDCNVGRASELMIDEPSAWQLLGDGGWGRGTPVTVFGSGPHRSAVMADPRGSGFVHLFARGFGTSIEIATAPHPEGPWTAPSMLAPCDLPTDDPGAYCAGVVVYRELLDPLDAGAVVLSYSVGSTSADQDQRRARNPDAYGPRIVRLRLP